MLDAITQSPSRRTLFVTFVLFVFGAGVIEIAAEFADGEPLSGMIDDVARLVFSGALLAMFAAEHVARRRTAGALQAQLDKARGQLAKTDASSRWIASQYRDVMQTQFDAWRLTDSEQDVVIGILKGLSFRDIAELRDTREKTLRQQASSVYRKAGVSGRNELTAWFFEDMLEPPPVRDDA